MAPRRVHSNARAKPTFRACPLTVMIRRVSLETIPPARTAEDHDEASRVQEDLQRDFLDNATRFHDFVEDALNKATAVPVPRKQHLDIIRGHFNDEVDSREPLWKNFILTMDQLPSEYKQELERSEEWRQAVKLVNKANRMVETLNHPASIERSQRENEHAPSEFQLSANSLRGRRKGILNTCMRLLPKIVERVSTEPLLPICRRRELVEKIMDAYDADMEGSSRSYCELKAWAKGKIRPELIRQHLESQEIDELEETVEDHLFALHHSVVKSTTTVNYGEAWTIPRLDFIREVLKAAKDIVVDCTELKKATHISRPHRELLENFCPICYQPYEDPTCVVRNKECHHVFCFGCIVPWMDQYSDCPKCRAKAEPHNLQRLTVTRVESQENEQAAVEEWKKEALAKAKKERLLAKRDMDEITERMADWNTRDEDDDLDDGFLECLVALDIGC